MTAGKKAAHTSHIPIAQSKTVFPVSPRRFRFIGRLAFVAEYSACTARGSGHRCKGYVALGGVLRRCSQPVGRQIRGGYGKKPELIANPKKSSGSQIIVMQQGQR